MRAGAGKGIIGYWKKRKDGHQERLGLSVCPSRFKSMQGREMKATRYQTKVERHES